MANIIKKHKYLCIALLIVFLVYLPFILFNDHMWIFAGDSSEQVLKIYLQGWTRIREGQLPFWDWSNFLGANYYGGNSFLTVGSPFYYLAMLLPKKEMIPYFFLTLTIIKSMLCTIFSYMWLHKLNNSKFSSSIGALIITFSGFMMHIYSTHFLDVVIFIPLALYFAEVFLKEKKVLGFSLSIAIIGVINYYFLYIFLFFISIYLLCRYIGDNLVEFNFKEFFIKVGIYIGILIISILIAMFILLPSMYAMANNPRTSDMVLNFDSIGRFNLYRFITSFINPVNDWRANANYFINTTVHPGISYNGGMNNYSMILFVWCVPLFLSLKNCVMKKSLLILYGLYGFFSCFNIFYYIFNNSYETRWMVVFSFINAMLVAHVISNFKLINKKMFVISSFLASALIVSCLFITNIFNFSPEFWGWDIIIRNSFFLIIFIIMYLVISLNYQKMKYLLYVVLCFEIGLSMYNILYNLDSSNYPLNNETFEQMNLGENEVINAINEKDDAFYRVDIATLFPFGINDAIKDDYKSFNTYHSVYNYNQSEFIKGRFANEQGWLFNPQRGKTLVKNMLSSKYWFSYGGQEFDYPYGSHSMHKDIAEYGYEYYMTVDNIDIYQNSYFLPVMFAMDKTISTEIFNKQSILVQDYIMSNYLVFDDSENEIFDIKLPKLILDDGKTSCYKDISEYDSGILYIEFASNAAGGIFIKDASGNLIYENAVNGDKGYFAVNLNSDMATFEAYLTSGFKLYYDDMLWYDDIYNSLIDESLKNIIHDSNSIDGEIEILNDKYIFTSIPYDEGWNVLVDGEKVDYFKVNNGFIGFGIEAGTHTIETYFIPKGLIVGTILSILGFVLLFVFNKINNKKFID